MNAGSISKVELGVHILYPFRIVCSGLRFQVKRSFEVIKNPTISRIPLIPHEKFSNKKRRTLEKKP
jgi:hypothetical protein